MPHFIPCRAVRRGGAAALGTIGCILRTAALADLGMVSFGEVVTPELAESIRSYVILEAQNAAAGAAN